MEGADTAISVVCDLPGDEEIMGVLNQMEEQFREHLETLELLSTHISKLNPEDISSPNLVSASKNVSTKFLEFCKFMLQNSPSASPLVDEILAIITNIFNYMTTRNNLRKQLLQRFKDIIGKLSIYSIRTLQLLFQDEEPLRKLLSNYEQNHFVASLLPEQDLRVEIYTILWQHELNRNGKFVDYLEHNNNELNEFIQTTTSRYEEDTDNILYDPTQISHFNLPRNLTSEEINQLPLHVIRKRLKNLAQETKLLKRQKREKSKEVGEISPRMRHTNIKDAGGNVSSFLSPRRKQSTHSQKQQSGIVSSFFYDRLKSRSNPRNSISVTHSIGINFSLDGVKKSEPCITAETNTEAKREGSDLSRSISMHEISGASDSIPRNGGCLSARFSKGFIQSQLKRQQEAEILDREPQKRLIFQCNGFRTEQGLGADCPIPEYNAQTKETKENLVSIGEWYSTYFLTLEHWNYTCRTATEGDITISVIKEKDSERNTLYRALYRSKFTTTGVLVPSGQLRTGLRRSKANTLHHLFQSINPLLQFKHFKRCSENCKQELVDFEDLEISRLLQQTCFKVGVLCWKEENKDEEDMFCNQSASSEYNQFLSIIGDEIELESWEKYSGGLDTSSSLGTGKYSLYTEFEGKEFMFHVAMLLPFSETNRQQVERKRHIGNDVIVIVFKEHNATPFLPSLIASRFNHIFIVVGLERDAAGDETIYHVAITSLEGVPPFGPALPPDGIFYDPWKLRVFLLRKLISGERAATQAPAFAQRITRTRELLLRNIYEMC